VTAGIQVNVASGDHHLHEAGRGNGFLFQAEPGKETGHIPGRLQADFLGSMALGFEEQQPEDQVSETLAAEGFQDTDLSQAEGAVLPPDAAGSGRDAVLINEGVPAEGVKIVGTAAEDGFPDRNNSGSKVFAGCKPFTLYHK
jgi:hypothetical protein